MNIVQRPRRNRKSESIRSLVRENRLTKDDLIAPLFLIDGVNKKEEISSMPGQYRFTAELLLEEINSLSSLGIKSISLFPALEAKYKDKTATLSHDLNHFYQKAISAVKENFPDITVMTDVAMDPYSSDGHDGLVDDKSGEILNDQTLEILAKMAVAQAQSGSDIIGPSDMMDGRVGFLRSALDEVGFKNVSIMSYTAKYCSSFYGPFRDALDSAPKGGDKKTYQMDFANSKEAIREAQLDAMEGADILMVKPGISYLDIVKSLKDHCHLPIAVYNVSGEYSMIKAAEEKGWLNGDQVMMEMLTSFKRAGADIILTYFAKRAAELL
mgnify:FL=1